MAIIDHQTGRIATLGTGPRGRPRWQTVPAPAAEVSTVTLSGSKPRAEPMIYTKAAAAPQQTAKPQTDAQRELTAQVDHPRAFSASKVFLDIAHFDGAAQQLVDVYA